MPPSDADNARIIELIHRFDGHFERREFDRLVELTAFVTAIFENAEDDLHHPSEELAALFERSAFVLRQMQQPDAEEWYLRILRDS